MAKQNRSVKSIRKKAENVKVSEDLTSTESFMDKYKKPMMIGGAAIVVIVLGIFGYQKFVSEPHEEESKAVYSDAFYEFEKDSLTLAANGNEYFEGMISIGDEYSGTSGGNIANYSMGVTEMRNAEYQNALDYFDKCEFEDIIVSSLVIGLKGDCYVEMDDYETAVDLFEEAANNQSNEFTTPMFLKKAGLTYEALGNSDKALTSYNKIKNDWSKSEEAIDIDKYIARIQS